MSETKHCAMDTRDLVVLLADLAEQIETVIGKKGAISVFRFAGKQMGKRMASGNVGNEDKARQIVSNFFQQKEFMDDIELQGYAAQLHGCRIGLVLKERDMQPGSHALCHFGFGLIDGVMEGVTGKKIITMHVSSEYHPEGITCRETW